MAIPRLEAKANKAINPRILRFIQHYVQHGNAAKAVREAGYNTKYSNKYGHLLLRTKRVRVAIDKLTLDKFNKGYVLNEYKQIVAHKDTTLDRRVAIEALKGISAIQGHNAPLKTESVHITGTLDEMRTILSQYDSNE